MGNTPSFFVNICDRVVKNTYEVSEWDIKNINLCDDWGRPLSDPDEPTGYDYIPEEYHEEMNLIQVAKHYGLTPTYLNEEVSYDFFVRMSAYVKAFNYSHPKKKGQIPPGM